MIPKRDRIILLLILLVWFLAGLAMVFAGLWVGRDEEFPWSEWLIGIGTAFVGASVVAAALERYLKDQVVEALHKRVSGILDDFAIRTKDASGIQRLPPELLQVIRDSLLEATVIERDVSLHLDIGVIQLEVNIDPDEDGNHLEQVEALRAEVSAISIYENLRAERVDVDMQDGGFPLPDRFNGVTGTNDAGFVSAKLEVLEGSVDPEFDLDVNMIGAFLTQKDERPYFNRKVELGPRARVRVTLREIAYLEAEDWDNYTVDRPTINFSVSISVPGGKFRFKAYPDDVLLPFWKGSVDNESGEHEWHVRGALLPGQGLTYEWEPESSGSG